MEGEDAEEFLHEASTIAQRPIEALWKQVGNKPNKKATRVKTRGPMTSRGVTPKMDSATRFAIVNALNRVDLSARKSAFYDPREAEVVKNENVEPALAMLRSWLRTTGLRCLDIFQAWDVTGDFNITRRELGNGLAHFGLVLTEDLITLVFDAMCEDHHLSYDEFKCMVREHEIQCSERGGASGARGHLHSKRDTWPASKESGGREKAGARTAQSKAHARWVVSTHALMQTRAQKR